MIIKDMFSLDIYKIRFYDSRGYWEGLTPYCYICKNATPGCKWLCKRYMKRIETDEQFREIDMAFLDLAELGGKE